MSLDVTPDLLESAERGEIDEADFIQCVRTSLPYAWDTISLLVAEKSGFQPGDANGHGLGSLTTSSRLPTSRAEDSFFAPWPATASGARWSGTSASGWPFRTAIASPYSPAMRPRALPTRSSSRPAPRSSTSRPPSGTAEPGRADEPRIDEWPAEQRDRRIRRTLTALEPHPYLLSSSSAG